MKSELMREICGDSCQKPRTHAGRQKSCTEKQQFTWFTSFTFLSALISRVVMAQGLFCLTGRTGTTGTALFLHGYTLQSPGKERHSADQHGAIIHSEACSGQFCYTSSLLKVSRHLQLLLLEEMHLRENAVGFF